jgi:transposase
MGCDQAVLPKQPRGIPRVDDRRVLDGICYRAADVKLRRCDGVKARRIIYSRTTRRLQPSSSGQALPPS